MKITMLNAAACLLCVPAWMLAAQQSGSTGQSTYPGQSTTSSSQSQTSTDQSSSTYSGSQSGDRAQMMQRVQTMFSECNQAQSALDQAARLMGVTIPTAGSSASPSTSSSSSSSTSPSSSQYPSSSSSSSQSTTSSSSTATTPRTDESSSTANSTDPKSWIAQAETHMQACTSMMNEMRSMHHGSGMGSGSSTTQPNQPPKQ